MLCSLHLLVGILALLIHKSHGFSFLSVGDWGGAFVGYQSNVYAVANQMATVAQSLSASFVIGTGDNFYWCGIQYVHAIHCHKQTEII